MPKPGAAAKARGALGSAFSDRLSTQALADLKLVASELVTNAVKYGPGKPISLSVWFDSEDVLRGEVCDEGEGEVAIDEMRDPAEGGFGLRIVGALSERWAVYEGSTHVWFEIAVAEKAGPR